MSDMGAITTLNDPDESDKSYCRDVSNKDLYPHTTRGEARLKKPTELISRTSPLQENLGTRH